jgi:hypothetical protein
MEGFGRKDAAGNLQKSDIQAVPLAVWLKTGA